MEETTTFGQWVKQRRNALSLTQAELGNLAFCSAVMIKKIEGNQRRPSVQVAKLLARYLKISPKDYVSFLSLARPDLSPEQISEIIRTTYEQTPGETVNTRRINNLPVPMTPLIGRTQEVEAVCGLILDPNIRLVTLTGAGGTGKTRLSLQVASETNKQFVDGCWFISLAAIEEPDLFIPTIARGLGIKESRHQTFSETLVNYLIGRDMLIVLDNFEQIIPAARQVVQLLALAPRLKILVTSRTVLHLSGEHEFVVPPLQFNDPGMQSSKQLTNSPAVALFVQKAHAVNIDFALTPENSSIVAKICARLDGLPLAIELAASRSKFLSPAGLLARLEGSAPNDGPLAVLSGGAQDLPARQQTMRRAIEWSYNLLSKSEQDLFRALAIFVGGCTLDAAAQVCGEAEKTSPLFISSPQAIVISEKLASLVAQSMLRQIITPGEAMRYSMLESLREYALERLTMQEKEWTVLRRRHADYYSHLAQVAEPKFETQEQGVWLDRLELEHDNFLAALAWSCTSEDDGKTALLLAGAIWQFWLVRGYVNEGRAWLVRILEQTKGQPAGLARARALNGAGFLHWAWGDFEQANRLLRESIAIFGELNNNHGKAWALNHLGHVALSQNDLIFAQKLVEQSLALFRELGADWNIAWDLLNLGDIVRAQGNEPQAILYFRECLSLFRKQGDYRGTAWALDHLGRLAYLHQDYGQTLELMTESLSLFRKVGDKRSMAWVLNHLGGVALAQHNFQQAGLYMEESIALFREMGSFSASSGAAINLNYTAISLNDTDWVLRETDRTKVDFSKPAEPPQETDKQASRT